MSNFSKQELHDFIVKAKANSYVGRAPKCLSYRPGSNDILFQLGSFKYLDSYFGGTDFLGQEVVYFDDVPVWVMNYYGKILCPEIYDAGKAGNVILESLALLYESGHFLGDSSHETELGIYHDTNEGDVASFSGYEWIDFQGCKVYDLTYHGGMVK
ncbi:DUF5680 domain-containing protein [Photobacterium alginatilyticum]|uniref:DUF5680 domain-containing protein n=1 Tax=Photobacterium alginatilyticum TaxID=1775171 RepID=A0ABW9YR71_9GAMM|nr:DUF5680 domain-containing protein [Photobacterium alginatilyticum]NBI56205.1 hypothetical protein [Photobacterium alginatilyticum]